MIHCRFCGFSREPASFVSHEGILEVARNGNFLDEPGAREKLAQACEGHVYCAGLTPAVRHPISNVWVAGLIQQVGGRDETGHPFYAWMDVPVGMSPAQAAEIQFPHYHAVGMGDGELSQVPITQKDLLVF